MGNVIKMAMHRFILCTLLVLFVSIGGYADITGSQHDFQNAGWNLSGEICVVCHTPHSATVIQSGAPLWNHETTTAAFTLYSSSTLDVAPNQPQDSTRLCLSCHDGTVALDSFGGNSGSDSISELVNLGTDLSNDHPVSIQWTHQTDLGSIGCMNCHGSHPFAFISELPFFSGNIECATCHDVHGGTSNEKMLRKPSQNSEICRHCHGK